MATRQILLSEFLAWNICGTYSSERISELMAGESITAQDLRNLDIPEQDRLWALINAMTLESQLQLAAAVIERMLISNSISNPQAWKLVAISRQRAMKEVPPSRLENEMLRSRQSANSVNDPWHAVQSVWASSFLKGDMPRVVLGLVCKVRSLGHPNALSEAMDDAVRLLEAE